MITIIHGNDIEKSRNFYIEQRQRFQNPDIFEGEKLDYNTLFQALEGNSLFSEKRFIFIENYISKIKSNSIEFKQIVEYLNKNKDFEIVFWEDKELTKTQIAAFKNASAQLFNYPQVLFTFLDNIKPNNPSSVKLFHDLSETMETELIFYMMIRQFRLLLAVSSDGSKNIDEAKRLAPWQISKLKKQAQYFGKEKLIHAYKKLYKIDYETKYGLSSFNLSSAIDIFLIGL
ncbi:MAG: hypothetical protein HY344_04330 [Candidatus Levybacteria bacterium]|nr:hypothetical protein [Candidatus Levybacteria bacterium]